MSTLVEDVQALLVTLNPAGGVWYAVNTKQQAVYPYVVWQRIVSVPNVALSGPSALQNTRIQIDIYARQVSDLVSMETSLEAAWAAALISNVPLGSQDVYEDDVKAYRSIKDYSIWASN